MASESSSPTASKQPASFRWRRMAVFTGLLLVLFGANLLYAGVAARETLLTGEAGDLLYIETFDEITDEWDLHQGQQRAKILDGSLELSISSPQTEFWSSARQPRFADFDITFQATALAGPVDNAFGIIFRLQDRDEQRCDLPAVILCGIEAAAPLVGALIRQVIEGKRTSYYAFLISSDGYYSLRKVENGGEQILSAWIASPAVNQNLGSQNTIRAVGRGADFQFYINGEPVPLCIPNQPGAISTYANGECIEGRMQPALHDDSLATGKLGVIAQTTPSGGGGLVVQFDKVMVFSPASQTANGESRA